ncbi:MAG: WD40 repeat domain-containing protein [bacterium]
MLYALQSTSHPKLFLYQNNFEADDVAFSENNPRRLAAIDNEGKIVIWNLISNAVEKTLVSAKATSPLAFSPDGKTLATASRDPAVALILWHLEGDKPKTEVPGEVAVTSLAFNPDGNTLITGSFDGSVNQWDTTGNQAKPTRLYQHDRKDTPDHAVYGIVFNANGKLLASGSNDGTAILWDRTVIGGHRKTFAVRGDVKLSKTNTEYKPIVSVAFNHKEDQLAAGSIDEAFIWDIKNGKPVTEFSSGSNLTGMLVSFSSDDQVLTAFGFDGALILWQLETGQEQDVGRQFYKPAGTHCAALSNDGQLLALPREDGMVVWSVFSEKVLPVESTTRSIAFSPALDSRIMATGGDDGSLTLWKIPSTDKHERIGPPIKESSISSLAFSESGKLLAVGSEDGTISLRDPQNNSEISTLDARTGQVIKKEAAEWETQPTATTPVAVAKVVFDPKPGSSRLAAIVVDLSTYIRSVARTKEIDTAEPDNQKDLLNKIIIWNTSEQTSTKVPTDTGSIVTSLAFSPDDQILAYGGAHTSHGPSDSNHREDFNIVLSDGQKQVAKLSCDDRVASLAFSRQGQILAAGLDNGKILLWDATTRKLTGTMEGPRGRVTDLAFTPDGSTLATVTNKKLRHPQPGVITLWDVETQRAIGSPLVGHKEIISAIAFSPDGKILASGGEDAAEDDREGKHNIIFWDLDIKGADNRFREIIDCQPKRAEVVDQVKHTSWFQRLYSWVSTRLPGQAN